jgi:hypothetical protein
MYGCKRNMAENTEKIQEQMEMAKDTNSRSGCCSENDAKEEICPNCSILQPGISQNAPLSEIKNGDTIADGLLRLCSIINGTWNDILASIQSISVLREMALYIDCTILAIWKHKKQKEKEYFTKFCSECGFRIGKSAETCPKCGKSQEKDAQ